MNQPTQSSIKETNVVTIPTPEAEYAQGQIVAKFKPQYTDSQINQMLSKYNASIIKKIEGMNITVIKVPVGQETAIQTAIAKEEMTQYSEPDYILSIRSTPNDQNFGNQWGLNNTGQTINNHSCTANGDVNAPEAWDITKGSGVTVGIVDSGIDASHPEFAGKIVASKGFAASTANDGGGHGTHVAGIVAASGNNSSGITGVCPECKLAIAKVLNDSGEGSYSQVAEGLKWAVDQGVKVINMSATDDKLSQSMKDTVDYVLNKNVVLVVSAGNDNNTTKMYPAAVPGVIAVASTNCQDQKSSFSTYGNWVTIAAPGTDIYSTFPQNGGKSTKGDKTYGYMSGTSMSAPLVAGIAALIWTTPAGKSRQAVIDQIYNTADKIQGTGTYWQNGRVNAFKAVSTAKATATDSATVTPAPTASSGATAAPISSLVSIVPGSIVSPTLYCLGSCPQDTPSASSSTGTPSSTSPLAGGTGSGGGLLGLLLQLLSPFLNMIGLGGGGSGGLGGLVNIGGGLGGSIPGLGGGR